MYDETNVPPPEFRVRPVVRYVVTRYCFPYQFKGLQGETVKLEGSSSVICEVPDERLADEIISAMQDAENASRERMKACSVTKQAYPTESAMPA